MKNDFMKMMETINDCINLDNVEMVKDSKYVSHKKITLWGYRIWIWYSNNKPMKMEVLGDGNYIEYYNK